MLIDIVNHHAAHQLLERVEQNNRNPSIWGALHFAGSKANLRPDQESLLMAIRPLVDHRKTSLYLFDDGDIVITCQGPKSTIIDALRQKLYAHFNLPMLPPLDHYFDSQAQAEELRMLCKHKIPSDNSESVLAFTGAPQPLTPSVRQLSDFRRASALRAVRKQLDILIVEDQPFSAKLLAGLLGRISRVYIAPNAEKALAMYLAYAPDMVFLDVEMPDINGHELVPAIQKWDPDLYVIMVTANHYAEDVRRAKENGAKGFVVKPYSKQKILEGVEKYIHDRKLTA